MAIQDTIDALGQQVNATTSVEASAKKLIDGQASIIADIKQQLANNGVTAAQMQALTDYQTALKTSSDDLAADVTANTPAA
jgi:hypothetical protein